MLCECVGVFVVWSGTRCDGAWHAKPYCVSHTDTEIGVWEWEGWGEGGSGTPCNDSVLDAFTRQNKPRQVPERARIIIEEFKVTMMQGFAQLVRW